MELEDLSRIMSSMVPGGGAPHKLTRAEPQRTFLASPGGTTAAPERLGTTKPPFALLCSERTYCAKRSTHLGSLNHLNGPLAHALVRVSFSG